MVVETTDRKQIFAGGQGTLDFNFRALVSNPEYIKVLIQLISTGVETPLTYGSDYSVVVNSTGIGGTVTVLPTYSTAYNYVVYRETVAKQESDYDDFNQFPADTLETDLDKLTMVQQEQGEQLGRTLKYPISESGASLDLPAPDADKFIAWNGTATALVNKDLPDPNILAKASGAEAVAGTNDANYMTPLMVKTQVENSGSVTIPFANIASLTSTIINLVYPIGSIYTSIVSTNPGTVFGIGTWSSFGSGRCLVGVDTGQTEFDNVEETGGAKTVTLTAAQSGVPAHTHAQTGYQVSGVGNNWANTGSISNPFTLTTSANTPAAAQEAHTNLQPYITVYFFKRTA
jgi:hypothetical protein